MKKKVVPQANLSYLEQRRQLKLKAPHGKGERDKEKKEDKKVLGAFFKAQTLIAPSKCENCGKSLAPTIAFHPRAHICHIVPKTKVGGCPSVGAHPMNRFFGCLECHTFYDDNVAEGFFYEVVQMPIYPTLVERFKKFEAEIIPSERKNIPEIFTNVPDKGGKSGRGKAKN